MSAPFMQLYVADYLADTGHLTTEEQGAYLLLLLVMWHSGGSLTNNPRRLARIAGVSPQKWKRIAPAVMAFFVEQDGVIASPALERWRLWSGRRPLAPSLRQEVFERDGFVCAYCGSQEGPFEVDHVHPWSRGGRDDLENLTVACRPCNQSKRDRTVEEWRQ